ncbi:hypothetical protein BHE74_00029803 [Ensete ventricosum]|nr:hypothetical protein BHE74_00029803 [Ensete ventricosum]
MFDTFRFVAADFTSGVEVFDSCDGSFESDFFVGFFEVELPLMDVTASFGLLEEGAGRGLPHEMLPSERLSVTAVAVGTLRRPSFGDLARVGGICYKTNRSVVQARSLCSKQRSETPQAIRETRKGDHDPNPPEEIEPLGSRPSAQGPTYRRGRQIPASKSWYLRLLTRSLHRRSPPIRPRLRRLRN